MITLSSLHSPNTALPLRITEESMRKILSRYRVEPSFLPVLFSFGDEPHISEGGDSNAASKYILDGSHSEAYESANQYFGLHF